MAKPIWGITDGQRNWLTPANTWSPRIQDAHIAEGNDIFVTDHVRQTHPTRKIRCVHIGYLVDDGDSDVN